MANLVFVYGTLKKGRRLNSVFTEADTFLSHATTVEDRFDLIGGGSFPYMTDHRGGFKVEGDLYQVSDNTLKRLDIIEGVPGHYKRETILVDINGKVSQEAFVYLSADEPNYNNNTGITVTSKTNGDVVKTWDARD